MLKDTSKFSIINKNNFTHIKYFNSVLLNFSKIFSNNKKMNDLENQKIIINPSNNENLKYGNNNILIEDMNDKPNNYAKNQGDNIMNFIQNPGEAIAKQVLDKASENISKSWYERFKCFNLDFLQVYFNITTDELFERLYNSIIPLNSKFYDISQKNPDLYGPFWIYTTLIFVIAASGSLTKQLNGVSSDQFFQEFVPLAASLIYGIGFVLPLILTIFMKCFGTDTSFVSIVCIYGYSFTIYIPTVIACCLPFNSLQWLLIGYAAITSTLFLVINYWKELDKYITNRKYFMIGLIIIFQASLFMMIKFYFFGAIKEAMGNNLNTNNISNIPK